MMLYVANHVNYSSKTNLDSWISRFGEYSLLIFLGLNLCFSFWLVLVFIILSHLCLLFTDMSCGCFGNPFSQKNSTSSLHSREFEGKKSVLFPFIFYLSMSSHWNCCISLEYSWTRPGNVAISSDRKATVVLSIVLLSLFFLWRLFEFI